MKARKIGTNKGRPRLWLEDKILSEWGWQNGDRFSVVRYVDRGEMDLRKIEGGERKVAGTPERPIVDILGKALEESGFASGDQVTVSKRGNRIMIRKA